MLIPNQATEFQIGSGDSRADLFDKKNLYDRKAGMHQRFYLDGMHIIP